jgi:hypothetical protein
MSTPAPNNKTSTPAAPAAAPAAVPAAAPAGPVPHPTTLTYAANIAIQHDKPIMLDYYVDTAVGRAFLGEDEGAKQRVLVKSKDEFTSSITRTFKVGEDFIIMTENSIYIVSGKITRKRISMAALNNEE